MKGLFLLSGVLVMAWGALPFFKGQPWLPVQLPLDGMGYSIGVVVLGLVMFLIGLKSKRKRKDVL